MARLDRRVLLPSNHTLTTDNKLAEATNPDLALEATPQPVHLRPERAAVSLAGDWAGGAVGHSHSNPKGSQRKAPHQHIASLTVAQAVAPHLFGSSLRDLPVGMAKNIRPLKRRVCSLAIRLWHARAAVRKA